MVKTQVNWSNKTIYQNSFSFIKSCLTPGFHMIYQISIYLHVSISIRKSKNIWLSIHIDCINIAHRYVQCTNIVESKSNIIISSFPIMSGHFFRFSAKIACSVYCLYVLTKIGGLTFLTCLCCYGNKEGLYWFVRWSAFSSV